MGTKWRKATIYMLITVLYLGISPLCQASTYVLNWKPDLMLDEIAEFHFGKTEFDAENFSANVGDKITLTLKHRLNNNDDSEKWGLWFYDGINRTVKIKKNNLLSSSGANDWVVDKYKLTKDVITNALYANQDNWYFILRETLEATTGNTIELERSKLITTASVPLPGALWFMASGMIGIVGWRLRSK